MGDRNDAVKALQARLKELGYLDGSADGDFGGATKAAVVWFQTQNGETPDGIAGAKTLALLFSDSAPKAEPTPTPDPNALPILVNRTHPVDASYRPADLVQLKDVLPSSLVTVKGSDCEGDRTAAQALITMFEAAKADGVTGWQISAGYRSVKYQQKLFDRQVAEYQNQGLSVAKAKSAASKLVADPGASEHHTGLGLRHHRGRNHLQGHGAAKVAPEALLGLRLHHPLSGGQGSHHGLSGRVLAHPLRGRTAQRGHAGQEPLSGRISGRDGLTPFPILRKKEYE